jgi:hypothetical protein
LNISHEKKAELDRDYQKTARPIDNVGSRLEFLIKQSQQPPSFLTDQPTLSFPSLHFSTDHSVSALKPIIS